MDSKLHNRRHHGLGSSPLHGGGRKSIQGNEEIILRGRWPSSSSSKKITPDNSLADYLASDGLAELLIADKKKSKSKSNEKGPQFGHPSEETKKNNEDQEDERIGRKMSKENRPFGNSMRYIGKLRFPKSTLKSDALLQPGRMSVDENALAAMRRKGTTDFNIEIPSTDSERSESTKGKSPRIPRARTKDSEGSKSIDRAPAISKIATAPIRRSSSSLTGNNNIQSNMSQWALSPGRRSHSPSVPPPLMMSTINDGAATATPLRSFSSLRPDGSSDHKLNNSNKKVVGNILTIGLDLFRKKTGTSTKPTRPSSPVLAAGDVEYRFSMLYNCLIQWRYANARSDTVNRTRKDASQNALLNAWIEIAKMQTTVMEKKIQLQREKLSFKLNKMLSGQINSLEGWGDIERQHVQFFSKTQNCLEAAVCRLPLVDKAKADPQLLSIRFRQATNLNEIIKSTLGLYTSPAEDIVPLLSELAHVVDKEKLLLEECLDMMADFAAMQIKEESLMSHLVQLKSCQLASTTTTIQPSPFSLGNATTRSVITVTHQPLAMTDDNVGTVAVFLSLLIAEDDERLSMRRVGKGMKQTHPAIRRRDRTGPILIFPTQHRHLNSSFCTILKIRPVSSAQYPLHLRRQLQQEIELNFQMCKAVILRYPIPMHLIIFFTHWYHVYP